MANHLNLQKAIAACKTVVGNAFVLVSTPEHFEVATFATDQCVKGVLYPANRDEVIECLKIANTFQVPLYPVSGGKNWGYGSKVPPADGCVIMCLERLNRIVDYDEQLSYISVEPGVTFAQVHEFLNEQHSTLMLGIPGSTPYASLIGNALERGISSGLDSDKVGTVCGLEVVLPDGQCLHTGMMRFANTRSGQTITHGLGAALDGLFFQSNLGIVTRMTFWLTPMPAFYQYCTFSITSPAQFDPLIDALQVIKREKLVETSIGLFNAFRLLSYMRQHPDPAHFIPMDAMPDDYLSKLNGLHWAGELALTAPDPDLGVLFRRRLRLLLQDQVSTLNFHTPNTPNPLIGNTKSTGIRNAYWRKSAPPGDNPDPDQDRCGFIWCTAVAPFRPSDIRQCVNIMERVMHTHQFDPMISIQMLSMRSVYLLASIIYDRDQSGQDNAASQCYHDLQTQLTDAGFIPYRLPIIAAMPKADDDYAAVLHRIKMVLDPNQIIAPGRYE